MKKKIIIDTDPGHDDAIAILMLLAERQLFDILGITTVAGNNALEQVTSNMLKILELTHADIPVAKGSSKPLSREVRPQTQAHGQSGMDGPVLPLPKRQPVPVPGVQFLNELISRSSSPVSILALGPLTNIARLLTEYPDVRSKIDIISLMGGGLSGGNITEAAEFNFYADPEAADIVFRAGIPITMSGLDVTEKAMLFPEEWSVLHKKGTASRFAAELLDFYSIYSQKLGFTGSALHDVCAAVWLIQPDIFQGDNFSVKIETQGELTRGMSVADRRRFSRTEPNACVLLDLDRDRFADFVITGLEKLDRQLDSQLTGGR